MRADNRIAQPELFFSQFQIHFHRIFGNSVRIKRFRLHILCKGWRIFPPVCCHGRCKNKLFDIMINGRSNQIGRANQIIGIIIFADKRTQPLGGISGKMIDIIRLFITKKPVNGFQIRQINIYALGTVGQIFLITAGEIIDTDNIISLSQQMTREIAS